MIVIEYVLPGLYSLTWIPSRKILQDYWFPYIVAASSEQPPTLTFTAHNQQWRQTSPNGSLAFQHLPLHQHPLPRLPLLPLAAQSSAQRTGHQPASSLLLEPQPSSLQPTKSFSSKTLLESNRTGFCQEGGKTSVRR